MSPTCHPVADGVVRLDFTLFKRSCDFAFLNVTCPTNVSVSFNCETERATSEKQTLAALKGQGSALNTKDKTLFCFVLLQDIDVKFTTLCLVLSVIRYRTE